LLCFRQRAGDSLNLQSGALPDVEVVMTKETIAPNHVVAVVASRDKASEIAGEVEAAGLPEAIVITDDQVGERLEAESTLPMRVFQRMFNHLSEEINYLNQYEEAARRGQTVVAVKAENDDEVETAKGILSKHGAVDIRYFGRMAVSDLTPDSNPSATQGDVPTNRPQEHS
jgi:hypothetical protein